MNKPHIKWSTHWQLYRCDRRDCRPGWGRTPKDAYISWRQEARLVGRPL